MSELHDAAWKGDRAEVASLLLDAGADANANTEEGDTPLSEALRDGHTHTAELLRASGGVV